MSIEGAKAPVKGPEVDLLYVVLSVTDRVRQCACITTNNIRPGGVSQSLYTMTNDNNQ